MAKKVVEKVNKSQLIRDYLTQHPDCTAKNVVDSLGSQGVTIHPSQVYVLRGKMNGHHRTTKTSNGLGVDHLLAAKEFVDKCGGYSAAFDILNSEVTKSILG
jgi:hypothetical protein